MYRGRARTGSEGTWNHFGYVVVHGEKQPKGEKVLPDAVGFHAEAGGDAVCTPNAVTNSAALSGAVVAVSLLGIDHDINRPSASVPVTLTVLPGDLRRAFARASA